MKTAPLALMLLLPAAVLAVNAPAALAKSSGKEPVAAFGKKRDNHTPIEVTADTLEVLQDDSKAIFGGHVVAIQGDLRLTADTMTVYYAKRDAEKKGGKEENAIKKIDAEGKVFLATPEETASGAKATYDVDAQEIRMGGKVSLTRGKNVLEGEKLVYNFATGKSRIVGGATAGETGSGKRVRALFVPEEGKEKSKEGGKR